MDHGMQKRSLAMITMQFTPVSGNGDGRVFPGKTVQGKHTGKKKGDFLSVSVVGVLPCLLHPVLQFFHVIQLSGLVLTSAITVVLLLIILIVIIIEEPRNRLKGV
jgi:hypothetical protein